MNIRRATLPLPGNESRNGKKEDTWKPVIEPADQEETAMVEERVKDYESDPSAWINIRDIK
jgi:hypothetical protein